MNVRFLFILCCVSVNLVANESPYKNYSSADNVVIGVSALAGLTSLYLEHQMNPLTPEQAARLDRNTVNRFDRPVTFLLSPRSAQFSDYGMRASLLLPLVFLADSRVRRHSGHVGYLYFETMAITGVVTELTKVTTQRLRPWAFNENVPLEKKKGKEIKKAFFSGHTSASFAGAVFFAKVFSDFYPDSRWKPVVWSGCLGLASAVGYWRVRAGRHYPTDVIAGALFGGVIAYVVPELHKKEGSSLLLSGAGDRPMMFSFRIDF